MISLICCYNDKEQYENMKQSLMRQSVEYELIGIDNRKNKYSSAAAALNAGARKANGDFLIFLHQDIIFEKPNSLSDFVEAYPKDKNAIIGLFGASHGKTDALANDLFSVQTLDECFIGMSKDVWNLLKFNEKICDGWHLYAVELCLRAKEKDILIAKGNFNIKHLSSGNVDDNYMCTFKKLITEYKSAKWIATTCKSMPTNTVFYYAYYCIWKIKKAIFGNANIVHKIKRAFNKV